MAVHASSDALRGTYKFEFHTASCVLYRSFLISGSGFQSRFYFSIEFMYSGESDQIWRLPARVFDPDLEVPWKARFIDLVLCKWILGPIQSSEFSSQTASLSCKQSVAYSWSRSIYPSLLSNFYYRSVSFGKYQLWGLWLSHLRENCWMGWLYLCFLNTFFSMQLTLLCVTCKPVITRPTAIDSLFAISDAVFAMQ